MLPKFPHLRNTYPNHFSKAWSPGTRKSKGASGNPAWGRIITNKWVFPKIGGKKPKSSILIGFSIIFTIHFGGFHPIFGNTLVFSDVLSVVDFIKSTTSASTKSRWCCLLTPAEWTIQALFSAKSYQIKLLRNMIYWGRASYWQHWFSTKSNFLYDL